MLLMSLMSKAEKAVLIIVALVFIVLLFIGLKHDIEINDWCNQQGGQIVKTLKGYKCLEIKEIK